MVCPDTEPTPDLKTQLEIAKGIGKELVNTIISTLNLVSSVDAPGLDDPSVGIPLLTPSNDLQEGGMGGTSGIITGLGVLSTTAAGAEAIATRGAGEASTVLPKEGVYEGPDATVPGRTYVGQSGDIPSRLARHEASGKFAPGTKVSTTEVTGGKTAREVAEHNRIQNLGGVRSRPVMADPSEAISSTGSDMEPQLNDPDFVSTLVFENVTHPCKPKPRFAYLFPNCSSALIQARLRPDLSDAQRSLAALELRRGDVDAVRQTAQQIITAEPYSPDGFLLKGIAEIARQHYSDAQQDAQPCRERHRVLLPIFRWATSACPETLFRGREVLPAGAR